MFSTFPSQRNCHTVLIQVMLSCGHGSMAEMLYVGFKWWCLVLWGAAVEELSNLGLTT
jgi:hypothetical protein